MLSQAGAALPAASQGDRQQRAASKYDFVKVRTKGRGRMTICERHAGKLRLFPFGL